jgi:hypothetical protein
MICSNCKEEHTKVRAGKIFVETPLCRPKVLEGKFEIYTSMYQKMENLEYLEYKYEQSTK